MFLSLAWLLRPRLGSVPKGGLDPNEFPLLYDLMNRICDRVGSKRVSKIIVDEDFNASIGQFGWRREAVLWIGLPLWTILSPEERIGVLAHEAAHGANGDPARSTVIGSTLTTLEGWLFFMRPDYVRPYMIERDQTLVTFGELITRALFWLFSLIVEGLIVLLLHLIWRNNQTAEYLADYLASRVSGTPAMIRMLNKLNAGEYLDLVLRSNVFSLQQSGAALLDKYEAFVADLPEVEITRLIRTAQLEDSRLDATHPPTGYRVAFLENHAQPEPTLELSDEEIAALDRELACLKEGVGKELINYVMHDR